MNINATQTLKHIFAPILFLSFFSILAVSNAAEKKIDLLLEEETLLVVYVDFSRLDAKEIIAENKTLVTKFINDTGFNHPEFLEEFFPNENQIIRGYMDKPEELARAIDGAKSFLVSILDIREAYCVLDLRAQNPLPVFFAIPKPNRNDANSLRKKIPPKEFVSVYESNDFLFITPGAEFKEKELARFMQRVTDDNSQSRPELREAIRDVEKYPIWAVFSVPKYVKKIIRETKPFLPEEFKKVDLVTLMTSLSWTAVGIDPAKSELYGTSAAESDIAASQFHRETYHLLSLLQAKVYKNFSMILNEGVNEHGTKEYVDERSRVFLESTLPLIAPDHWKSSAEVVFPEPQGNRFTIHWNKKNFESFVGGVTPLIAKGVEGFIVTQRDANRNMRCTNNMKMLGLVMHNYYDTHKCFPSAYTLDAQGKPLHSWRVLVLPFLGKKERELYNKIRLDEPWDSEHNRQFHDQMPNTFQCPGMKNGSPQRDTVYCMIVGEDTFGTTNPEGRSLREVLDGTSNTILIAERKTPVCWMSPVDITQAQAYQGINKTETGIGSFHGTGANVGMCDGAVLFIPDTISPETLKAKLTIAGGEKLP